LERKRRDHIKDSFSSLRDSVPLLHGEKVNSHKVRTDFVVHKSARKNNPIIFCFVFFLRFIQASRAQILKKAAEYIDHMRRKNTNHQKDIDLLRKKNKLLEDKSNHWK
jgi:Max protein